MLTDHGVQLLDVYVGPSGLLTGSARVAQEARERAEAAERKQQLQRKNFELKHKRQQLEAQIASMRAEFEIEEQGLLRGAHEMELREKQIALDRVEMGRARKADLDPRTRQRPGMKEGRDENWREARCEEEAWGQEERSRVGIASIHRRYHGTVGAGYRESAESVRAVPERAVPAHHHRPGEKTGIGAEHEIMATPTLVRVFPGPEKTVIGSLSDTARAAAGHWSWEIIRRISSPTCLVLVSR